MNWLTDKIFGSGAQEDSSFSYDQAVIITITFDSEAEFGERHEFDSVQELERQIAGLLPQESGVDGDEFGEGTGTIYVYGPSADVIWDAIEDIVKKSDLHSRNYIEVTLQYGLAEDPDTKDKKFTL